MSPQAKLLDAQSQVTNWIKDASAAAPLPALGGAPFRLVLRQDVVNAVVAALLPPEELTVLLDYVVSLVGSKGGTLLRRRLLDLGGREAPWAPAGSVAVPPSLADPERKPSVTWALTLGSDAPVPSTS